MSFRGRGTPGRGFARGGSSPGRGFSRGGGGGRFGGRGGFDEGPPAEICGKLFLFIHKLF